MTPFQDFLAMDSQRTLDFFLKELTQVTPPGRDFELRYNASVLAHFAITHCEDGPEGCPQSLDQVFEQVFTPRKRMTASDVEHIASTTLFFSGFFGDQLRRRHNLNWYGAIGSNLFGKAAQLYSLGPRAKMMQQMSNNFEFWQQRHLALSRNFRNPKTVRPF